MLVKINIINTYLHIIYIVIYETISNVKKNLKLKGSSDFEVLYSLISLGNHSDLSVPS